MQAAAVSWMLPGRSPDTYRIVSSGEAITRRFTACILCLPKQEGRSAAIRSIGMSVPSITT
ncbi:hypothetical protein DFR72_117146 [Lentzea flaviverrucosa]|uniref:Uncharacterized protein n=1 Tax=Lentzea flaviverrucosa TaxID=200379 RepID=A0A1H9XSF3_9PSEU|nr:hypothetical protein DFR72_117146 [Lentzea flaviverrucosa]SES49105.1 hypothetical protein SAMN05216195_11772 [Lentzea flaviverrucosa]